MAIDTNETRSILSDLAQICRDGEEGYRDAAEKISRPDLKTQFLEYSSQRSSFAGELNTLVAKLGGEPSRSSGSLSGSLHRGWLNLKAMVTGSDDAAIISECERGEDSAVKHYRDALAKDVPTDVRDILQRQFQTVQETHNRVRALEIRTQHA